MTQTERDRLLLALSKPDHDFTASFMAVHALSSGVKNNPGLATPALVNTLSELLIQQPHHTQSKAFFLYRTAAEALCSVLSANAHPDLTRATSQSLERILFSSSGQSLRAASEATGSLPVHLSCPKLPTGPALGTDSGLSRFEDVLHRYRIVLNTPFLRRGRSLVFRLGDTSLLVLKCARTREEVQGLLREAYWMDCLGSGLISHPTRFDVPIVLKTDSGWLCRPEASFFPHKDGTRKDTVRAVLPYQAPAGYFDYPNEPKNGSSSVHRDCLPAMIRGARLFGHLAGCGILHTAPIPLFHNRVQQHRRLDHGVYEWHRGGRLDQWLSSTRFPNFCVTGLRDFEHFETMTLGGTGLYRIVGSHLLSLLLVCCSYFRHRNPCLVGKDAGGAPVDARHLFEPAQLETLFRESLVAYASGFLHASGNGAFPLPFDMNRLVRRMIDEAGVDRHMDEVLRVQDQLTMDRESFRAFLKERGVSTFQISRMRRGAADVPITTGPHLGGFNQSISVPELIEAVAATASLCILKRFTAAQASINQETIFAST